MLTVICLMPAAALFAHQIRKANARSKQTTPTMADIPVIVLIGDELEVDL